jgi:phage terminase large subunit
VSFGETGLTNTDIANKLKAYNVSKKTEIIADSAEPKSIEELKRMGWYITGAKKGADSIKNSIDILKRYKINVTRNSINLRDELNRYKWRVDHSGKTINEPVDACNHLIDPLRYVALNKLKVGYEAKLKSRMPFAQKSPSAGGGIFDELIGSYGLA